MKNPYQPVNAEISQIVEETPNIKTFVLKPEEALEFKAGQFIELTVPGAGEAPFTPSSSPHTKDRIEVTIMNVGKVTEVLHNSKEGERVGIRGPYGKEYPLSQFAGKEILIVGGGVGLAPLRSLLLALTHDLSPYKRIVFCYGARTPKDIIYKDSILNGWQNINREKLSFRITVDEGDQTWKGKVGLVTTTLEGLDVDIDKSISIVCGPPIMMKFTTFKLVELGYKPENIYLSMEKNMSCGIGKCGHCILGKYYVCKDGPVFTYDKIKDLPAIWD